MDLKIKKVKINKGIPEIDYVELREDNKNPEVTHVGKGIAHDDFINAVSELAAHYALISGYASFTKGLKLNTLKSGVDNFKVSGYSIGGKEDNQGITITGHVIVAWSGKACIVNAPFTLFDESEETKYKFIDQLAEAVEKIEGEAKAYINGKFKPEAQQEIPFGTEASTDTILGENGHAPSEESNLDGESTKEQEPALDEIPQ